MREFLCGLQTGVTGVPDCTVNNSHILNSFERFGEDVQNKIKVSGNLAEGP